MWGMVWSFTAAVLSEVLLSSDWIAFTVTGRGMHAFIFIHARFERALSTSLMLVSLTLATEVKPDTLGKVC